jgi:hypothetical protein
VTLSDGRLGIVTAMDPEDPYRPTVKPLGADGWTMTGEGVVLARCPDLSIAEASGMPVGDMVPKRATKSGAARAISAA